jgi:hypothetical protein
MLKQRRCRDCRGFGAKDAAAERDELSARSACLIEFFVGPTAFGTDDGGHNIRVNLCYSVSTSLGEKETEI